jgi:hypothetical protein
MPLPIIPPTLIVTVAYSPRSRSSPPGTGGYTGSDVK